MALSEIITTLDRAGARGRLATYLDLARRDLERATAATNPASKRLSLEFAQSSINLALDALERSSE